MEGEKHAEKDNIFSYNIIIYIYMKNKTRSKRGGASSTLHTKPYKSINFNDQDVRNIIDQEDGVVPPPITLPPQNPNTTINFANNPGIFTTNQFNIGDNVRIISNGIFNPMGEIIDINMDGFGQIINYIVHQPQQGPFDDEELELQAHEIYLDPDVQQGGGGFDDDLKNCSDCLSWAKTGVIAGLGANTCKYCIPHKTRISNILDQIFYFDKVDITGGHMGNDGWSNQPLGSTAIVSEFTIFTRNFRYFYGNFEEIEPILNNTPHLERFYKLYKSLYLNYFLEEFKWKDDRIRRGVSSDNIIGQKKDLFILNDKFTIKDKASVVKIIYDYEKQLNTQVLFFYNGTERYGDRKKWLIDTKNKIIEILSVDIFEKRYREGVHQRYYNTITIPEAYLHWFENVPDNLYDVARFSEYIDEFLNMNNNENDSDSEDDFYNDGFYHQSHESGQHPAFTGKETADKEIVRQGINEPSIASDIYAPGGMNQTRLRNRAVPKTYDMNRGGKSRKKKKKKTRKRKKRKKKTRKRKKRKKKTKRKI